MSLFLSCDLCCLYQTWRVINMGPLLETFRSPSIYSLDGLFDGRSDANGAMSSFCKWCPSSSRTETVDPRASISSSSTTTRTQQQRSAHVCTLLHKTSPDSDSTIDLLVLLSLQGLINWFLLNHLNFIIETSFEN